MAKALSSRRRKAANAWADPPPDDPRQVLTNGAARADTIRMAARELSVKKAQVKALNAEIREFKAIHIKGDLGFKLADWALIERAYELEDDVRDVFLDTVREGWEALGIGGQLDWIAAERGEAQPNGAAAPRRRGKTQPVNPRGDNPDAYEQGEADGFAGHRDHAARWPQGEIGAAAYELGHDKGSAERYAAEVSNGQTPPEAAPKRGRGRPRKTLQPELSIAEGTGGDAAA